MSTRLSKIMRKLAYLFSAIIIFAALLVSVTGLLTPVLNQHRAEFEKLASSILNMPVMIGNVTVSWHGYSPEINLDNVTILDVQSQKPKVELSRLEIDFSLWHTLLDRHIAIRNIKVNGVKLTVTAKKSGIIQVGNLGAVNISDTTTGASLETAQALAWIFSQPRLALGNIEIHIIAPSQPDRFVTVLALSLKNDNQHHDVDGKIRLNQELPTKIDLHIAWNGDVSTMQMREGDFYLYLEGLSLPQWFSTKSWLGFQIKNGLASIKLWARWQDSQWKRIQSTFQVYGLETYSSLTKHIDRMDRINGNVGWKRNGQTQIFAGDELFIDFPNHLWPETNFEVTLTEDAAGNTALSAARFNYLNLTDMVRIALESTALPENFRHTLVALHPQGELKGFDIVIANTMTDLNGVTLQSQFSGLSINPWQSYPGVSRLDGKIQWDKTDGSLDVNDNQVTLTMPTLFLRSLYLDQVVANVKLHQDANGNKSIQAKNMELKTNNADIKANLQLTIPTTDSPQIDLNAEFTMAQVAKITDYLPMKIFDPDLQEWLTQAFKKGHTDAGKIVLQGKLADFPFDNNGLFLVSTAIHNADLDFAPGWPAISHIEGQLTFKGRSMTIDIASGQLLDIPLKNIHGEIPFIGDAQPQILHVGGVVNSDLAEGMHFIRTSPLQKTVGKDLTGMQLLGPMQLTLGLVVPLKHPDATTVKGTVAFTNANMDLPAWKLHMLQMNGAFQFTEESLTAKKISALLFNSPATLDITTLIKPKKSSLVRADLAGQIGVPQLESWTGLSLSSIAKGSTTYQAQLLLSDHVQGKSNEVIIRSDLQGVSLNAPLTLGKKAEEKKNLIVDITLADKNSLNTRIDYASQLSSALTLTPTNQGYQVYGGEVRLSAGKATFQKAKGMLITAELPQLDWDLWQAYFTSLKTPGESLPSLQDYLRGMDLRSKVISVANQQFHNAHLNVTWNNAAWLVKLDSTEIGGDFTVPFVLAGNTVEGDLRHLTFNSSGSKRSTSNRLNPVQLPALHITADVMEVNGISMSHVTLHTVPSSSGMQINRFSVDDPLLQLQAYGTWVGNASRSNSHLQGTANTKHISELLNRWGFDTTNFVGSTGDVSFKLNFSDAPYRLSLDSLTGDLSLKLGEGRIVELSESNNAKIGLGRMLNLFSLSSIPRRLSLHFSDLFEKGYSFDSLTANITLRSGSAFTENMRFEGPIASVAIKGRVGLKAKDFDVQFGVTPYVTGSLPLVATLAGGPVAGVATWVVDKVISSQVAHTTTYQYSVKGPWSNPVWAPITAIPQHPSFNKVFPFSLFNAPVAGSQASN